MHFCIKCCNKHKLYCSIMKPSIYHHIIPFSFHMRFTSNIFYFVFAFHFIFVLLIHIISFENMFTHTKWPCLTTIQLVFAFSIRFHWYETKLESSKFKFVNIDLTKPETQHSESSRRITIWKMRIVSQVLYFERWTMGGHAVSQSVGPTAYLQ